MTAEQFGALLRTILQPIAVLAIAKGIGDENLWLAISAGIVSIGTGAWSFWWIKKAKTA